MLNATTRRWLAAATVLALLPGLLFSGEASRARRDLGRAVPSDASIYFHYWLAEADPAAEAAAPRFGDRLKSLLDAARGSGYLDATFQLILQKLSDSLESSESGRAALERTLDRWKKMLGGVDWGELLEREAAFAARKAGPRIELVFAFRVPPGELERILESFRRILYGICATSPELEMSVSLREDEKILVLYDLADGDELSLGGRGDVVLWASTARLLRHSLQLLAEEGSDIGFAHAPPRAAALESISFVPPKEGFEFHLRPSALLPESKGLSELESFVLAGSLAFDAVVYSFQGKFSPAEPGGLRTACLDRPSIQEWLRRVPEAARSFDVSAGADPQAALDLALPVLARVLPANAAPGPLGLGDLLAQTGPGEGGGKKKSARREDPLGIWDDLVRVLSGRRMLLGDSGGFAALFELRQGGGKKEFLRLFPRLETGFQSFGLNPEPATLAGDEGPPPSREESSAESSTEEVEILRKLDLKPFFESPLFFGVAQDFLVCATSPRLARDAVRLGSGKAEGKARELPQGLPVPSGTQLRLRHEEPPFCLGQARFFIRVLEAVADVLPEGTEGLVFQAILKSAARLESVLQAGSFLRCHDACTTREGDFLRGSGRVSLGEGGQDPKQSEF